MSICDNEENRKKLAWLVPGYILLAWFFCVLFQPLGIHSPTSRFVKSQSLLHDSQKYNMVYLLDHIEQPHSPSKPFMEVPNVCNGTVMKLGVGPKSAAIIRLSEGHYPFAPFNCSIQIDAMPGLDGLGAVIEEMDLREHVDDSRQPGGHWASSMCIDYLEVYTDKSKVKNKLCGKWNVYGSDQLSTHGPQKTLVGYCYDDRSGHSCESKKIFINVVINPQHEMMQSSHGINLRSRKGFSIVVTGYRHPAPEEDSCRQDEMECRINDYSLHSNKSHCIWRDLNCDTHLNCGFTYNTDESDCSFVHGPWSISTLTLLIIIYLAIVLILVFVTLLLLRWHKALRAPIDLWSETRAVTGAPSSSSSSNNNGASDILSANMYTTDMPDGSTITHARTGTVSIFVSYRPQSSPKLREYPPTYESLFLQEDQPPPNYNLVAAAAAGATIEDDLQGGLSLVQVNEVLPDGALPPPPTHSFVSNVVCANDEEKKDESSDETNFTSNGYTVCDCDCDHSIS